MKFKFSNFSKLFKRRQTPLPMPVIIGMDRSGNTLLRLMLDSHSELAIPPETDFLPELIRGAQVAISKKDHFIKTLINHWRFKGCQIDPNILSQAIKQLKPFTISDGIRIFYKHYAERFGKHRFGDNTPFYLHHMELIQSYLPEAHFIHIVRDGRDAALSILPLWFGPQTIAEAARWWQDGIDFVHRQTPKIKHFLEVKYEDLLLETEAVMKQICQFLQLEWDENILNYHSRSEDRLKIHALTKSITQINRASKWKTEMSENDQALFNQIAEMTLLKYNYL